MHNFRVLVWEGVTGKNPVFPLFLEDHQTSDNALKFWNFIFDGWPANGHKSMAESKNYAKTGVTGKLQRLMWHDKLGEQQIIVPKANKSAVMSSRPAKIC